MKRPPLIGLVVLIGVLALVVWIARNTYWDEIVVPALPRGEAISNPFYAAERLAAELGARSEWRRTLGELPSVDSIMVLTHWNWDLIDTRRAAIERWVESGGRLILDSTLAAGGDALQSWSGLHTESPFFGEPEEAAEESEPQEGEEEIDVDQDPEFNTPCRELSVKTGESQTNPAREYYNLCALAGVNFISAARKLEWALEDDEGIQVARVRIGQGSVTLINGTPFGNRELLEAENAVLLVDVMKLHRGDLVVFVSEEERASLLELIWLYGAPAVLLALALIGISLWRNATRFGPLEAAPDPSRRSLGEQIRGTGQFALRVGGGQALHAAMVRALQEAARLRIPSYETLSRDDQIDAIARLSGIDAESLAGTLNFSGKRRPHEFKNAMALLDSARNKVLAHTSHAERASPPGSS